MHQYISPIPPRPQLPDKRSAVDIASRRRPQDRAHATSAQTIAPCILLAEDGELVAVTILLPPQGPGHDKAFDNYLGAKAYARLVRLQFGWRIVDRCDTRTKPKALVHG